jgi:Signal transduction histidine kinase
MELDIESLKESNEFLNDLYQNVTTAIFLADGDARIRNFNDAFAALFLPDEREVLGELCGNAIGCRFVLAEGLDCGRTSNCGVCNLRRNIVTSFTERVPVYRDSLEREFLIGGMMRRKHFRFTTKYEVYRSVEYVLVLVDDVTELVEARAELEDRNTALSRRNLELEEALGRETAALMANAREIERLGLEREELEREVQHRVGNNLQVISSLISLGRAPGAARGAKAAACADSSEGIRNRITSLIEVYKSASYEAEGAVVRLPSLLRALLARATPRDEGPPLRVELDLSLESAGFDKALPIGLFVGDFLCACRLASSAGREPEAVGISLSSRGKRGRCELAARWPSTEGWTPLPSEDFELARLIARQCGGDLSFESDASSARLVYEFPL